MKPYPTYKDSGIEWLGEIPAHWDLTKLKYISVINPSKQFASWSKESEDLVTFLPMEKVHEDGTFDTDLKKPIKELWNGFTYFEEDDTIVAKITPCFENGKGAHLKGLASSIGFGSTEFHVLRARLDVSFSKFLYYLTRSHFFRVPGEAFMSGAAGQKRVPTEFLEEFVLGTPPLPEQRAIADYLDRKTGQIDRLIEQKQRQIELLKEQRTALINRAVTKGLNPDAPMKDSGIEWLGEVPEHWKMVQIGYMSKVGNGSTPSRGNAQYWNNGSYPWLNSSVVHQEIITEAKQFVTLTALSECHLPIVPPNSVLVAITGQGKTRGTAALLGFEATINQHLAYITPVKDGLDSRYLFTLLRGLYNYLRYISDGQGGTRSALTCEDIKHFKIPVPPISEQGKIADFVEEKSSEIDHSIDSTQKQIELLQEYRTALISEAVTGKIDVRGEG